MHDLQLVAVLDPRYELLEESPCARLWHTPVRDDVVEQLATCVLKHNYDICRRGYNFVSTWQGGSRMGVCLMASAHIQLDDVRMPQGPHVIDFPLHACLGLGHMDDCL